MSKMTQTELRKLIHSNLRNFSPKGVQFLLKRMNGTNKKFMQTILERYSNGTLIEVFSEEEYKSISSAFGFTKLPAERIVILSTGRGAGRNRDGKYQELGISYAKQPEEPDSNSEKDRLNYQRAMVLHNATLRIMEILSSRLETEKTASEPETEAEMQTEKTVCPTVKKKTATKQPKVTRQQSRRKKAIKVDEAA